MKIVRFLVLAAQANVNKPTNGGSSPLTIAADGRHLGVVEFLIQQGADVDYALESEKTALRCACNHRDVEICGRLLIAGATVQPQDFQGPRRRTVRDRVLNWVTGRLIIRDRFISLVLFGMRDSSGSMLSMIGGVVEVRVRLAELLDIQTGQALTNLRATIQTLQAIGPGEYRAMTYDDYDDEDWMAPYMLPSLSPYFS